MVKYRSADAQIMETKKWYQSKSVWFAILTGVAGVTAALLAEYPNVAVLITANSMIQIGLRFLTTTPLK